ncbi:hypothetical protein H2204_006626 [Knufia peltigerae]|uniref:Major facilitator superfamily (MFS) profile domain-containing protein n=1 Tax=Knufia peltigerae TaxID=1002370 RepID=A0AA39CYQ9_9EURO|nr:hypothetical protein H2204_006626 [Knufia peltigerae]
MQLDQQATTGFEHVKQRQFRFYNVLVTALMATGSFGAGYAASIIGTTLAQPSFLSYFELTTRPDGTQLTATTNGLFFTGGVLGVGTISWMADRWGRLWALRVSSAVCLVASACLAGSVGIGMFIAFRTLSGAGVFMLVGAIPMWISETAPPSVRGFLGDFHSVGILFGYALASYVGYGFYQLPPTDDMAWRGPFVVGCGPLAFHLVALFFLPESPRWLMMQGRAELAERTLRRLHTADEAAVEMRQISAAIEVDRHLDSSWASMFLRPAYRKRILISSSVVVMVESAGVLVINNYGPSIYGSLGFDTDRQLVYNMGYNTMSVTGGLISLLIIDRIKRPRMLATGLTGACATLIVLAAILANNDPTAPGVDKDALRAGVAVIYIYTLTFELFLNGTMFTYMAELFPTHIRSKGLVVTTASLTAINILWTQVAPTAFDAIGWKFYLCFIIPPMLFAILVWFTFPNTLGVPLEDIARIFGDHEESYMCELTESSAGERQPNKEKPANETEAAVEVCHWA